MDDQLSLFEDKKLVEIEPTAQDYYDFTFNDSLNLDIAGINDRIPQCVLGHLELVGGDMYGYDILKVEVYEKKRVYHIRAYITTMFNFGV